MSFQMGGSLAHPIDPWLITYDYQQLTSHPSPTPIFLSWLKLEMYFAWTGINGARIQIEILLISNKR